jgi:hypothetical protein
LSDYISRSLQIPLNQHHFWTDSQNVIYWVNGSSSKFKPFVAHRVAEIQKSTSPIQWKHLPGAINPADIATRGITLEQLVASETWMDRPSFLHSGPWPEQRYVIPEEGTSEEKKKESTELVHLTQTSIHSPLKFMLLDATIFKVDKARPLYGLGFTICPQRSLW